MHICGFLSFEFACMFDEAKVWNNIFRVMVVEEKRPAKIKIKRPAVCLVVPLFYISWEGVLGLERREYDERVPQSDGVRGGHDGRDDALCHGKK